MQKIITVIISMTLVAAIVFSGTFSDGDRFATLPLEESAHETEWLYAHSMSTRLTQRNNTNKKPFRSTQLVWPNANKESLPLEDLKPFYVKNRLFAHFCNYLL